MYDIVKLWGFYKRWLDNRILIKRSDIVEEFDEIVETMELEEEDARGEANE